MREKKTPQQMINFWLNPIFLGVKALDNLMSRHEFFRQNPKYRYAILEMFIRGRLNVMLQDSLKLSPAEIYGSVKDKFGDRLGEYDVLIPALFAALNTQQKVSAINLQKFRKVAAQAKARIAQLENEIQRLKNKE